MKKIKLIAITLLVVMSMVGCENSTARKAVEQGKLLMAGKEYDKALASFKLAIDEGNKDKEIKIMSNIIDSYNQANSDFEGGNIENAKKIIDDIDSSYVDYSIRDDIDNLKIKIDKKLKMRDKISNDIESIKELVENKSYNDAKVLIEELKKNELNESDKEEIEELNNNIDSELAKIEADKKEKEEKIKKEKVYSKSEVHSILQQQSKGGIYTDEEVYINGEKCYEGEITWGMDAATRVRNFYVGSKTLNIYNYNYEIKGTVYSETINFDSEF